MTLADEIRALKLTGHSPMPVFDGTWNAALDRAAALAEAHESALAAAAYEAVAVWLVRAGLAGDAADDPLATCIRAMTSADARAALDRMLAEARKDGMRKAAAMLPALWPFGCHMIRSMTDAQAAILAAAEKEAANG